MGCRHCSFWLAVGRCMAKTTHNTTNGMATCTLYGKVSGTPRKLQRMKCIVRMLYGRVFDTPGNHGTGNGRAGRSHAAWRDFWLYGVSSGTPRKHRVWNAWAGL